MSFLLSLLCTGAASARPLNMTDALARLDRAVDQTLTVQSCAPILARWSSAFRGPFAADPRNSDRPVDLINRMFALRQRLRARLGSWDRVPSACVDQVRLTLSALRRAEDHLALGARGPGEVPTTLFGEAPWLTVVGGAGDVKLRSGDVLVSRGNAFVSAAIAKIGVVEGDFSHLAQVYIDAPVGTEVSVADAVNDPSVFTIEAHIEIGSLTRPFKSYVADGNARVAHFRPRQPAADAHHAAWSIYDWVKRWQRAHATAYGRAEPNVNDNPPYDFAMDLSDAGEVFCAEIVSIAQATVGWRVPRVQTVLKQNALTRTLGITARTTFAPSDLEVDPRFEQLAEWRDLNKLGAVLKKDAVFSYVFDQMKRGALTLTPTPEDYAKAAVAWFIRKNDLGLTEKLPKNMNPSIIALTFVLDRIGAGLEDQLTTVP